MVTAKKEIAYACILWIQVQKRKLELQEMGVDTEQFERWSKEIFISISEAYLLNEEEQEWLKEMAVADTLILNALFSKVMADVPELHFSNSSDIHIEEVSRLISVLLGLFVFKDGHSQTTYDARLRTIFRMLIVNLLSDNNEQKHASFVLSMAELKAVKAATKFAAEEVKRKKQGADDPPDYKKWAKISAVTFGGGLLVGITGGVAAPFMATALTAVAGSSVAAGLTAISSTALSAIVGSVLGLTGAGVAGFKYNNRQKDLEEFQFEPINKTEVASMNYVLAISGWLPTLESGKDQWGPLVNINPLTELFLLSYERKYLVELTTAAKSMLTANILSYGASTAAAFSSAAGLAFAVAFPLAAIRATAMIDNTWLQSLKKSEQAGILMARSVIGEYVGGRRPVTLIGHGMGGRVIYFCLLELYEMRHEIDIYGMIENVYFLGASIVPCEEDWMKIIPIVSGRFVNCYSTNDWFLKILFRLSLSPCAGANHIDLPGIENIDVSSIIQSHPEYTEKREEILKAVGFEMLF